MNSSLAIDSSLVFESSVMRNLLTILSRAAQTASPILLTGETGTGKTELAKIAHQLSPRKDQSFVDANIAGNPESILESVLFGHVRGAYTGAIKDRKGKFEEADGGTIFLDEIGDLSLAAQITILKLIEEKKLERIGNGSMTNLDIRVVSATNRNLRDDIREGKFRKDLFFRLNELEIQVPALRERPEDILPLAQFFLQQSGVVGEEKYFLSEKAEKFLLNYEWPGNIRQLRSVILSAIMRSSECKLRARDLEGSIGSKDFGTRWLEGEQQKALAPRELAVPQADIVERFLAEDACVKAKAILGDTRANVNKTDLPKVGTTEAVDVPEKQPASAGTSPDLKIVVTKEMFSLRKIMQSIRNKERMQLNEILKNAKSALLSAALETAGRSHERAAQLLGVCEMTLWKWKRTPDAMRFIVSKDDSEGSIILVADRKIRIGQGCDVQAVLRNLRFQIILAAFEAAEAKTKEAAQLIGIERQVLNKELKKINPSAVA